MSNDTIAIVVTYNRLGLLKENISALFCQTKPIDILIVDNASTDETSQFIKGINDPRLLHVNTGANLGGAGGFAFGIKKAFELGYKYAWIMDDDSIPTPNAFSELKKIIDTNIPFSFLASMVYWTDGRIFPMNRPTMERVFDQHLDMINKGKVIPICSCSFVGCLFPLSNCKKIGLPISDFFIYGDDVEYTKRMHKLDSAYWVLDSKIIHKAPSIKGADIANSGEDRIKRFYYQYRNGMYIARKYGFIELMKQLNFTRKSLIKVVKESKTKKIQRLFVVLRGSLAGITYNPQIEYPGKKDDQV